MVLEFWFGHSKCHFFWSKNGHFWQKCPSLTPKKSNSGEAQLKKSPSIITIFKQLSDGRCREPTRPSRGRGYPFLSFQVPIRSPGKQQGFSVSNSITGTPACLAHASSLSSSFLLPCSSKRSASSVTCSLLAYSSETQSELNETTRHCSSTAMAILTFFD